MKPKFFLIVLPFMLNAVMCYAQKTHIIEPAELEITYSVKEQPHWDTYIFRCGRNVSQYFSQPALQSDKMLANDDPALFIISNERIKADVYKRQQVFRYMLSVPIVCDTRFLIVLF